MSNKPNAEKKNGRQLTTEHQQWKTQTYRVSGYKYRLPGRRIKAL